MENLCCDDMLFFLLVISFGPSQPSNPSISKYEFYWTVTKRTVNIGLISKLGQKSMPLREREAKLSCETTEKAKIRTAFHKLLQPVLKL